MTLIYNNCTIKQPIPSSCNQIKPWQPVFALHLKMTLKKCVLPPWFHGYVGNVRKYLVLCLNLDFIYWFIIQIYTFPLVSKLALKITLIILVWWNSLEKLVLNWKIINGSYMGPEMIRISKTLPFYNYVNNNE